MYIRRSKHASASRHKGESVSGASASEDCECHSWPHEKLGQSAGRRRGPTAGHERGPACGHRRLSCTNRSRQRQSAASSQSARRCTFGSAQMGRLRPSPTSSHRTAYASVVHPLLPPTARRHRKPLCCSHIVGIFRQSSARSNLSSLTRTTQQRAAALLMRKTCAGKPRRCIGRQSCTATRLGLESRSKRC